MIRLLPTSNSQTINIVPRDYSSPSGNYIVITEDGTGKSEEIGPINGSLSANGNFVVLSFASTILKAEQTYSLVFKDSEGGLLFRDKAYCSSQTNDEAVHTLNTDLYEQFQGSSDNEYIVLE